MHDSQHDVLNLWSSCSTEEASRLRTGWTGAILCTAALGPALLAQPMIVGNELQLNSYTTSMQSSPRVVSDSEGDLIAVWHSSGSPGTDTSQASIQLRRFDAAGNPRAEQSQVNTYVTSTQAGPDLAIDPVGRFVVVWTSNGSSGDDSSSTSIQAQRFDAAGDPLGGEFQVNSYTTGTQGDLYGGPSVATDASGNFVVVWSSVNDAFASSVKGQLFTASGTRFGEELRIDTSDFGFQDQPSVAMAANGSFVVAWQSGYYILPVVGTRSGSSTGSNPGSNTGSNYMQVRARRFAPGGQPLGDDFAVSTDTSHEQVRPDITMSADGRFVVVWQSGGYFGAPDGSNVSIRARLFDAAGNPQSGDLAVNTYTTGSQVDPTVAFEGDGRFLVTWSSNSSADGEGGIFGQAFEAGGVPAGAELQLNAFTTSIQRSPAIASRGGRSVVVWEGPEIHGRLLCGLFCDGFESGDSCAWSTTVPGDSCPSF